MLQTKLRRSESLFPSAHLLQHFADLQHVRGSLPLLRPEKPFLFLLKRPTLLPLLCSPRQAWARPQCSWCGRRRPDHGWEVSGALGPGATSPSAVLSSRVT